MKRLERYLITGLIVVGPVFLTIYLLWAVFYFIDGILGGLINLYVKHKFGFSIPGLGFLLFFLVVLFTGFLANKFIGTKIFPHLGRWFSALPFVNKIYPTLRQVTLFILAQKEFGFKKVVLAEYPSKGIWSLGFLTNEEFKKLNEVVNKDLVAVFVPSSPGPLTGYIIFIPREELKLVDIPISDALKIIISGGVYNPEVSSPVVR